MKNSKWVWWGVIGLLVVYLVFSGISRHAYVNRLAYDLQHGSQEDRVAAAKELMKRDSAQAVQARMTEELELFGERLRSPEAKEALGAFMEKRKPDFSRFS